MAKPPMYDGRRVHENITELQLTCEQTDTENIGDSSGQCVRSVAGRRMSSPVATKPLPDRTTLINGIAYHTAPCWCRFVLFPAAHSEIADLREQGNILLSKPKLMAASLEVAAYRFRFPWIRRRLNSFQGSHAVWQEGNASLPRQAGGGGVEIATIGARHESPYRYYIQDYLQAVPFPRRNRRS